MKEYIGRDMLDSEGRVVGREYSGELIRCKDCRYSTISATLEHENGDVTNYYHCKYWHRPTDILGFCDQGSRRIDDA